jgi:hypothetical protein
VWIDCRRQRACNCHRIYARQHHSGIGHPGSHHRANCPRSEAKDGSVAGGSWLFRGIGAKSKLRGPPVNNEHADRTAVLTVDPQYLGPNAVRAAARNLVTFIQYEIDLERANGNTDHTSATLPPQLTKGQRLKVPVDDGWVDAEVIEVTRLTSDEPRSAQCGGES